MLLLQITWAIPPESLSYSILFPVFLSGLCEKQHPYTYLVRLGIQDLLAANDAVEKLHPILPKLVPPLRAALATRDKEIFLAALDTFVRIVRLVKGDCVKILGSLIPPIASRVLSADLREEVQEALRVCEIEGGESALKMIRHFCPTYCSVFVG